MTPLPPLDATYRARLPRRYIGKPVVQESKEDLGWAIPSPDGKHVAIWEASGNSNVWLLEGF